MKEIIVKVENVSKKYKLGQIGGGTLNADLQSLWARIIKKEDPNSKIGQENNRNKEFYALKNISFEIYKGERVGIIGHNGAGKSTLLKLLSRVTTPTKGTIKYKGRIASMLEVGTGFHPELTGRENVFLNGAILGMSRNEISQKFDAIVDFAEMKQFIDTPVKRFSSGMYVKLAFAVAAHLDSEIMIMDEVLAVGDMKFQEKCLGKMDTVSKNDGRTILYVSHNMNTIRQLCNRCIVLDHGEIVFDGEVDKAIDIYLGELNNFGCEHDLSLLDREKNYYTSKLHLNHFSIVNLNDYAINTGERLIGILNYSSNVVIENLKFRVNIKLFDGTPITMSAMKDSTTSVCGENSLTISIDTANLVPGKYSMDIVAYEVNEFGTERIHDVVRRSVPFEIVASKGFNNNIEWKNNLWGNYYCKPIDIINNK